MQIVKVQRVPITIAGGSTSGTGTLTGFGPTTAKIVVFGSWTLPSASVLYGAKAFVKLAVTDINTITASRIDSAANEPINVEAYVVQFGDDTNVYKVPWSIAPSASTASVNINGGSAMTLNDVTKAFCWGYWTATETSGADDWDASYDLVTFEMTSASVVTIARYSNAAGAGTLSGELYVVESSTLTVTHGVQDVGATTATSLSYDFTPDRTLANTFVLASYKSHFSTWLSDVCWVADLFDLNTIRFRRVDSDSGWFYFRYQIISDPGITVSRGEFTHNNTSNTVAISVDASRSIPISNGTAHPLHAMNPKFDPGWQDSYANEMWIDPGTVLNVASTAAGPTMTLPWQVIQFPAESGAPARRVFVIT